VGVDGGLYVLIVVIVVVSRLCSHDSEGKRQTTLKITGTARNRIPNIFSDNIHVL